MSYGLNEVERRCIQDFEDAVIEKYAEASGSDSKDAQAYRDAAEARYVETKKELINLILEMSGRPLIP